MDPLDGSVGQGAIRALCVVTKDRPALLERCLRSFAQDFTKSGDDAELCVFDDTSDAAQRDGIRARLRQLANEFRCSVRYAGPDEKQRYVERLAQEAVVALPTVAFALGLDSGLGLATRSGANRNAALLDSAGEVVLLADDDVVAASLASAPPSTELRLSKAQSPWDMQFFEDLPAASRGLRSFPGALQLHAGLLGAWLEACAERAGVRAPVPPRTALRPRLRVTVHGSVGDAGWGSVNPFSLLLYHPELLQRTVPELVLGRILRRTVPCVTVARGSSFQAMAFGLDQRELVPPFSPVGRNQDGLFMHHLLHCFDDALVGHLPTAVLHEPAELRRFALTEFTLGAQRIRYTDCLLMATSLMATKSRPQLGSGRLSQLGAHLSALGKLPASELRTLLHERAVRGRRQALEHAERRIDATSLTPAWSDIFVSSRRALLDAIEADDFGTPTDLLPSAPAAEIWDRVRCVTEAFGQLLGAWPRLIAGAARLKRRGERLSVALG